MFLMFAMGILTFATACHRKIDSARTLRIPLGSEPPTLDPQVADTGISVFVLNQVISTLLKYDSQRQIVPADAESFAWNADGHELFVRVRPELKWSDGVALNACQYRDGILRTLDPKVPSLLSELFFDIENARERKAGKVEADRVGIVCDSDADSLTFRVQQNFAPKLLHALAFTISAPFRADLFARFGADWLLPHLASKVGVASGAFVIREWSHDRRVRLEARTLREKNLPADRVAKVEYVDLPLVNEASTALSMYNANEIDFVDEIPTVLVPKLKGRPDFVPSPYFTTYMVGFSLNANPVLRDKRVRQALAFAANQDEVPRLLGGGEQAAWGWIPPGLLPPNAQPKQKLFDPVLAKHLLQAAGFGAGKKFPQLKLFFNAGERHQLLMERIANNWRTYLGIQVELDPMEWKMLVSRLKSSAPDLYRYAWAAVYPDPLFFLALYLSDGLNNFGHWKNENYDRLVKKLLAVKLSDRNKAFWAEVRQAQTILVHDDPALIPIYHYVRNTLVKPWVKGLQFTGQGLGLLKDVSIEAHKP